MTQVIPEANNPTPKPQDTIETNGNGVPSEGHEEGIPNNTAELEVAENIEAQTGTISAGEQEILEDPHIKAEPSAEHTVSEIHPDVAAAGVTVVTPHEEEKKLNQAAQILGGQVVGHETPTQNLGQQVGEFNPPLAPQEHIIPENEAFKAMSSGQFAKGDGALYKKVLLGKWKEMIFAKVPKLFAGRKVQSPPQNISNFPAAQAQQEGKKAA